MAEETKQAVASDAPKIWPLAVSALLSIAGIGIGIYMSRHHELAVYGPEGGEGELWGCAEAEGISCDIVNTSAWSELFGVPQFTWAIPFYVAVLVLAVWGMRGEAKVLKPMLGLGVFGLLYSVFLGYISIVELEYICLWCSRLYGINALLLILPLFAGALRSAMPDGKVLGGLAAAFLLSTGVSVGVQKAYRAQLLGDAPELAEAIPDEAAVETASAAEVELDPKGQAPQLSWEVTTEDKNQAKLTIGPKDAWKGNPDAKVAVVEFADFECGYCKRASVELKRLHAAYGDRVAFVFKHYPMNPQCNPGVKNPKHREACMAADAAVCAQEQGRFWALHDVMFKNNHDLSASALLTYAESVGLDTKQWEACMRSGRTREQVHADGLAGQAIDIHGTPRIWIDGKLYRAGTSAEQMARALEAALGGDVNAVKLEPSTKALPVQPIPEDIPAMQKLEGFSIDTFEAGLADGKATVGKHQIPATRMSWFAARDACAAAGKRLCTEQEWLSACQGAPAKDDDGDGQFADDMVEGTTYPYGEFHQRGRCWDGQNQDGFRPVYTGEMPGCASKDGVYDLTGNVEEWVGATPETAVLMGGAFDTSKDFARCIRRNDVFGPGYANIRTGFRCCQ